MATWPTHRESPVVRQQPLYQTNNLIIPFIFSLQALNGFLMILTCDGEVFFATHTIESYLGFHQVSARAKTGSFINVFILPSAPYFILFTHPRIFVYISHSVRGTSSFLLCSDCHAPPLTMPYPTTIQKRRSISYFINFSWSFRIHLSSHMISKHSYPLLFFSSSSCASFNSVCFNWQYNIRLVAPTQCTRSWRKRVPQSDFNQCTITLNCDLITTLSNVPWLGLWAH